MKVLETPPEWTAEVTCRCETKLQLFENDLLTGHFGPNWGGETPEKRPYVTCPHCKDDIQLKWADTSRRFQNEYQHTLKERKKK